MLNNHMVTFSFIMFKFIYGGESYKMKKMLQ